MGFLKKLFGGGGKKPYVDKRGIYFYVVCDNCGAKTMVRADKQNDLNKVDGGFVWHKTIVDSKCFQRMQAVVHLNSQYKRTNYELTGGRFISQEEYEAVVDEVDESEPTDEEAE